MFVHLGAGGTVISFISSEMGVCTILEIAIKDCRKQFILKLEHKDGNLKLIPGMKFQNI